MRWWRLAAAQGHAYAQFNLGNIFENGRGIAQDDAESVRWYCLAAAQGDADAQFNLGVMFADGRGVAQDCVEDVRWWRLASAQGHADARRRHFRLGLLAVCLMIEKETLIHAFVLTSFPTITRPHNFP